jgi:hypothetical protein
VDRNHASGFHFPPPVEAQHRNSFDFAGFVGTCPATQIRHTSSNGSTTELSERRSSAGLGGHTDARSRSGLVRPASQFDPTLSMVNKLSTWHIRARLASPPADRGEERRQPGLSAY